MQLGAELQGRPLRGVLDEVEAFAIGDCLAALVQGDRLDAAKRTAIAERVARYTGLTPAYVMSANLRISTRRFWKKLLRDQRLTVGRLDSRYLGVDQDAAGENPEYDPAIADWNGPFANAVNRYLREELKYSPDLQYNIWGNVRPWDRSSPTPPGEMLRTAMRANPYLKVSSSFDFETNEEGVSLCSSSHTTKAGTSTTNGFGNAGSSALSKTSVGQPPGF